MRSNEKGFMQGATKRHDLSPMLQQTTPSKDAFVSPGMVMYTLLGNNSAREGADHASTLPVLDFSSPAPLARDHHRMNKDELNEFRDYLVKSSMYDESPILAQSGVSASKLRPALDQSGGKFINVTASLPASYASGASALSSASSASAARELLSATQTLPYEEPGMMNSCYQLPRESVAVLIDAVRASTLDDDEKCKFLFELFDVGKSGELSKQGVKDFVETMFMANNLETYGDINVDDIIEKLFAKTADPIRMTYREFAHAFEDDLRTPREEQEEREFRQQQSTEAKKEKFFVAKWMKRYRKHDAEVHWLTLYFVIMIAAFMTKAYHVTWDPAAGYAPKVAKGFAQIIMVDTLFLLFPMCRKFVAFLRKFAEVSSRVPVDQNIEFHKICGVVMLVASLGHTVAWVFIAYYLRTVPKSVWMESHFNHLTFVRYENLLALVRRTPMWTGVVMVLIACAAAPMTHPRIRGNKFNVFWVTHLMFIPFLILILIHGLAMWVQPPQAYFWVLPPIILYLIERRFRMKSVKGGNTQILRVQFSKDTVAIFMQKPDNFHFHPGMYMYLKVPVISTFEYHPFTISSAPEDEYVSVHVRKAGDWTGELHAVLRQVITNSGGGDDLEAGDNSPFPIVFIDGPVGAPSQDYYRYKSVVFVGAGIGVTPFASILQSIMHQWEAFRCDRCNSVKLPKTFKLEKIYFYWSTREQEAFTWFAETMNRLSAMDPEGRLEIHNYYSPLKSEKVIAPLHALQTFVHKTEGQDIISGLTTKQITHFGRPDWKQELNRIARQQNVQMGNAVSKRQVGVFFCGPKVLGASIHEECATFNQDTTRRSLDVVYDFHSENF